MNTQRAEQIIVISLVVTLASTVGGSLAQHKAKGSEHEREKYYGKAVVSGTLATFFLAILAEAAPQPAAYLSMALASAAFIEYGLPLIKKDYPGAPAKTSKATTEMEPIIATLGGTLV